MILSCGKDSEIFDPYQDIGQVENLINKINDNTESYIFDAQEPNVIVTNTNLVVSIPEDGLINENGEVHRSQAKVYVIDVVSSGQSILTGYSTKVEGSVFFTTNMMNLRITTLDGKPLNIKDGEELIIYHPQEEGRTDQDSKMYFGTQESNSFNWSEMMNPMENYGLTVGEWQVDGDNGPIIGYGYQYNIDKLGWIGVGNYFDKSSSENDKLCITLPELFNKDNTKVFFVFKEYVSVVNLQPLEDSNGTFCGLIAKPNANNGSYIISVSSTENGDHYLGFIENPNLEENLFEVIPQKTSIEKISQFLNER